MQSNAELIRELKESGTLTSPAVESALLNIDRKLFVPKEYEDEAYGDYPLPILRGQTISQPRTVVFMLELLEVRPGHKILDVGSGSGWTTALLSHLVGEKGRVIGVELVPELVQFGQHNLAKIHPHNARIEQAGTEFGKPDEAPFDRILVSAAAEEVPQTLIDQLKTTGRMAIPVKDSICLVTKSKDGIIAQECYPGFAFVPLILQ